MMKKIIHLFFPVIMLSLFSCHDTEAKHEMEEPDFDGFVKISLQSQITGVQPMTGTGLPLRNKGMKKLCNYNVVGVNVTVNFLLFAGTIV